MVAPLYAIGPQQPGGAQFRTLNGGHLGFTEGQTGTGSVWQAVQRMNSHLGTNWEALNIGLPNDMSDPAAPDKVLDQLTSCPLFIVFFAPLVPNIKSGTSAGSISKGLLGNYDAKITQQFTSMVNRGFGGTNVCCRITEVNGANFPWSFDYPDPNNSSTPNGMANVKAMAQRYLNLGRAAGYTGWLDFNGFTIDNSKPAIEAWDPQLVDPLNRVMLGGDIYNTISNPIATGGIGKDDLPGAWAKIEAKLDLAINYCRAKGYLFGIGEMGMIYNCTSPYSTNDGGYILQKLQAKCAANADVIPYGCLYNETTGNENDGFFYLGGVTGSDDSLPPAGTGPATSPTPVGGTAATYKSVSDTGTFWVDTPSKNKQLALAAYKTYWKAGSMIHVVPPTPPPPAAVKKPSGRRRHTRRVKA